MIVLHLTDGVRHMRKSRLTAVLFAATFFGATLMACPSWAPVKKGTCNPGRNWTEPVKDDKGWKAGACQDSEASPVRP